MLTEVSFALALFTACSGVVAGAMGGMLGLGGGGSLTEVRSEKDCSRREQVGAEGFGQEREGRDDVAVLVGGEAAQARGEGVEAGA